MGFVQHFEINFPTVGPEDAGLLWTDPIPDVTYIWDGVKWDVYVDVESQFNYWTRDESNKILSPRNARDSIKTRGYKFEWLDNLTTAPKRAK